MVSAAMHIYWRVILRVGLLVAVISACAIAMIMHTMAGAISQQVRLNINRKDTFERCEDPIPILNATLVSRNGSLSVNFSWTFAPLQDENATFCHHMLSVRSFQSSAPYDLEDKMEPPHGGRRYTMLDQQAHHHIFDNINRVTYYQFELRIQSGLGTGNTKYYKHYSYLYYFGEQVPARVVEPVREHSVIRVHDGDPVTIPCEGAGTPSPTVLLLREVNVQPPQACSGCPVDKGNNIAAVSENDAGEYFCVAANTLVNPPLGKRTVRDWKSIILLVNPVAEPPSNVSQCLPYTHSTCGAFLDTDLLVFVDEGVNGDVGQLQLQEEVLSLFRRIDRRANRSEVSNLDSTLRSKCHRLAHSIACHSVYPYCYSNHQVPTPRLICKTTCDAFAAGGICEEGFISEAETPELYAWLTIKCDAREHPAGSNPECIPIDLETAKIGHYNPIEHSWCAQGDGRSYAGPVRRTRSGLDCQSWSSQVPHKHPFWPSKYSPELISSIFSCRNPGGVGEGPWCYTADPNIRWEYCEVPQCEVCEPYEGYGFCHGIEGYRDGNWTVYVDRSPYKWGPLGLDLVDQFLEGLLPQLTEDVGNETWSPGCDHAVRQLLCHATLLFCEKQEAVAPLMACSGCQLLDTIHFCSTIVYSRLVTELQRQSSRFFFQPDDCLATAAGSNFSGPDCMPPPQGLPSETDECYSSSDHGQSYTGQLAITESGERCQSWDEPHLLFHPHLYSELDGAANLCRNPGQLKDRIWCFMSKEAWDYCSIPTNCTGYRPTSRNNDNLYFIGIAGAVLSFLLLVIVIIGGYCKFKKVNAPVNPNQHIYDTPNSYDLKPPLPPRLSKSLLGTSDQLCSVDTMRDTSIIDPQYNIIEEHYEEESKETNYKQAQLTHYNSRQLLNDCLEDNASSTIPVQVNNAYGTTPCILDHTERLEGLSDPPIANTFEFPVFSMLPSQQTSGYEQIQGYEKTQHYEKIQDYEKIEHCDINLVHLVGKVSTIQVDNVANTASSVAPSESILESSEDTEPQCHLPDFYQECKGHNLETPPTTYKIENATESNSITVPISLSSTSAQVESPIPVGEDETPHENNTETNGYL